MSDKLAEVALAFCRECMGWEDAMPAVSRNGTDVHSVSRRNHLPVTFFEYVGLREVMEAVKAWCDRYEVKLVISWDNEKWQAVIVKVPRGFPSFTVGDCTSDDLRVALLTATVNAEQKARSQEAGS
jgi:hypothetical protein